MDRDQIQLELSRKSRRANGRAEVEVHEKKGEGQSREDGVGGPALPLELSQKYLDQFDRELDQEIDGKIEVATLESIYLKNALLLVQSGEYGLAQNLLGRVLDVDPYEREAIRWMGFCFTKMGKLDEALTCYLALCEIQPDMVTLSLVAESHYLMNHDVQAKEYYLRALEVIEDAHPILFDIYKNLGNLVLREGDFAQAEEYYNRAHTIDPNSDTLRVNYGTLEIQRESYVEALKHFREALQINPKNDKAWVGLALIHHQLGDGDLAIANLERALDFNSFNVTALKLFAEWATTGERVVLVIDRLKVYLESSGDDVEIAFLLAKVFVLAGRLSEALIEMERVLALDPNIEGGVKLCRLIEEQIKLTRGQPVG